MFGKYTVQIQYSLVLCIVHNQWHNNRLCQGNFIQHASNPCRSIVSMPQAPVHEVKHGWAHFLLIGRETYEVRSRNAESVLLVAIGTWTTSPVPFFERSTRASNSLKSAIEVKHLALKILSAISLESIAGISSNCQPSISFRLQRQQSNSKSACTSLTVKNARNDMDDWVSEQVNSDNVGLSFQLEVQRAASKLLCRFAHKLSCWKMH